MIIKENTSGFWKYKRFLTPTICTLICIWGLFLRFQAFSHRELSVDEIYQFQRSAGFFKPVWERNYYGDFSCFPGDYLITYPFVKVLTGNEINEDIIKNSFRSDSLFYPLLLKSFYAHKWALAFPHIIATLFGFYFLYLLCQIYFETIWAYILAFSMVACNATLIYHAFEFRPYAVLPTLALGSLYFIELLIKKYSQLDALRKFWISLFFLFVVIFHAFGIIFLALSAAYTLVSLKITYRTKEKLDINVLKFLAGLFIFLGIIWLWYASINLGITKGEKVYFGTQPTFQFIPNPLANPIGFLKSVVGNLLGHKIFYFALLGAMASFFISHKDCFRQALFLFLFVVLGVLLVLAAVLKGKYWFVQRQFIWVMPLFAFFVAWCWDSLLTAFFAKNPRNQT